MRLLASAEFFSYDVLYYCIFLFVVEWAKMEKQKLYYVFCLVKMRVWSIFLDDSHLSSRLFFPLAIAHLHRHSTMNRFGFEYHTNVLMVQVMQCLKPIVTLMPRSASAAMWMTFRQVGRGRRR